MIEIVIIIVGGISPNSLLVGTEFPTYISIQGFNSILVIIFCCRG